MFKLSSPYKNVLYVGPGHKDHRGGIGAVLDIYSKNISPFNFVSTLSYRNKFYELFFFSGSVLRLSFLLLTNRKIRIVHIHGAKDGSIVRKSIMCFIARKLFSKKIVFHSHAGAFDEFYRKRGKLYKAMCRFIINNSEAVVVLSSRWNEFFRKTFRVKRIIVIRNPVEHRQPVIVKQNRDNKIVFLFLGKIVDHKGIFDLVKLVTDEQETLRGKCRFLVGGNHDVELLKQKIQEGGIGDLVEYIGWVKDEEKEKYFLQSDYFILPTYHEAMPMTILEALSYGKPVITTPVGSIPEVIEDNRNGKLFQPGDMQHLKKIILELINDRSKYDCMRRQAMNTATQFYPESIKTELEKLYTEIA
jgi:glycosyltransferase involved in cell wall biosynthesis